MRQCHRLPPVTSDNGQAQRKGSKGHTVLWRKGPSSEGQAEKNSSKLKERSENLPENKGPLWETGM
jgi:hypothetical protein